MATVPFDKKAEIVAEFYLEYAEDFPNLLEIYDLGFPLAVAHYQGAIREFTPKGVRLVEETFDALCEELNVDPEWNWDSLAELWGSLS